MMKWGLLVALIIVLIIGGIGTLSYLGVADGPSRNTAPDTLKPVKLPADLPPLYKSADPGGDANAAYQKLFDFYLANKENFRSENPSPANIEKLTDLMIAAKDAGRVTQPFLDDQVPLEPGNPTPKFQDALERGAQLVGTHAIDLYSRDQNQRAHDAATAVLALGQRAYENAQRLYPRYQGLIYMEGAAQILAANEPENKDAEAWTSPLRKMLRAWEAKTEVLYVFNPHLGDLVNVAVNDQDLTFRVAATLRLAIAKFKPGHRGNLRAINNAIAKAKASDKPLLQQAGQVAEAFTVEEMRRMK